MAQKVGNLVVEMSANVARLQRDFNKANSQAQGVARKFKSIFKGVGLSIAAGLSVVGLKRVITSSLNAADAIAKGAAKANIGTGAYQELTFALDKFDVSQQQVSSGLMAFTKRLGEARAGTGTLVTFLKKYDEALLDSLTSAESNEQALNIFMEALGGVKNDADRAALSAAAFSRSAGVGIASALKDGGKALDQWRKKARDFGIVVDADILEKAEDAKDRFATLAQVVQSETIVAMSDLVGVLSSPAFLDSLRDAVKLTASLAKVMALLASGPEGVFAVFQADIETLPEQIATASDEVAKFKAEVARMEGSIFPAIFGGEIDKFKEKLHWAENNLKRLTKLKEQAAALNKPDGAAGVNGGTTATQTNETAAKVIEALRFEQEQLNRLIKDGAIEQEVYNNLKKAGVTINSDTGRTIAVLVRGLEQQKAAQNAAKDAAIAHSAALVKQAEDSQLLAIRAAEIYESLKSPRDAFEEGIAELDLLKEVGLIDPATYTAAFNRLGDDFASTVDRVKDSTTELSEFTKEAFRSMQNVASDFFFDTLEGNFTDLGDSFRTMVNRMLADWASVKMMGGLFGKDFGKTGELGGMLGSIFGGARALGGPVSAGSAYLVGERGPELFMPQTSGNVVANNKLGGGTSISVPIGNIDGGSKQLLANLPGMIENAVLESMRRYA